MKSMLVLAFLVAVASANLLPGDEGFGEDHDHHHHHDHDHEHEHHHDHEHEHHHHDAPIAIVKSVNEANPEAGSYAFSFEAENGIVMKQAGELKRFGDKPEDVGTVASGSYSYPYEGKTYTIKWFADETGYHAEGDHLPKSPVV